MRLVTAQDLRAGSSTLPLEAPLRQTQEPYQSLLGFLRRHLVEALPSRLAQETQQAVPSRYKPVLLHHPMQETLHWQRVTHNQQMGVAQPSKAAMAHARVAQLQSREVLEHQQVVESYPSHLEQAVMQAREQRAL